MNCIFEKNINLLFNKGFKKLQFFTAIISVTNLFFSCGFFSNEEKTDKSHEIGMLPAEDRKYTLKSAIIKLKSAKQILGSDIETTIYLDDYGDKYCNITDTKLKYKNTTIVTSSISITRNDYTYTYNPEKMTGTKSENKGNFNPMHIDFASMDKQSLDANGIRKVGETECLGRICEVYLMENEALEMSGRYEVWNKIPLKFSTRIGSSQMEMYAVDVLESPDIPEKIFEIPETIEFTEAANPLKSSSEPALSDSLLNLPSGDK